MRRGVRTKTVKKSARKIIEKYYARLTLDFHSNKRVVDEVAVVPSKRMRNKIAGFVTHLMKRIQRHRRSSAVSGCSRFQRRAVRGDTGTAMAVTSNFQVLYAEASDAPRRAIWRTQRLDVGAL